jgi:hypothetical protein
VRKSTGKGTDARAPGGIDIASAADDADKKNQRLAWTRIALTHTHTHTHRASE